MRSLVTIDQDECRRRLEGRHVGRIGLSVDALPVVLPVNYLLDSDRIYIRIERGAKLNAARQGVVACLEIDDFDVIGHAGWSVTVTGRLIEVTDPVELDQVGQLPVGRWAPMSDPHFLAMSAELLTGRELRSDSIGT